MYFFRKMCRLPCFADIFADVRWYVGSVLLKTSKIPIRTIVKHRKRLLFSKKIKNNGTTGRRGSGNPKNKRENKTRTYLSPTTTVTENIRVNSPPAAPPPLTGRSRACRQNDQSFAHRQSSHQLCHALGPVHTCVPLLRRPLGFIVGTAACVYFFRWPVTTSSGDDDDVAGTRNDVSLIVD